MARIKVIDISATYNNIPGTILAEEIKQDPSWQTQQHIRKLLPGNKSIDTLKHKFPELTAIIRGAKTSTYFHIDILQHYGVQQPPDNQPVARNGHAQPKQTTTNNVYKRHLAKAQRIVKKHGGISSQLLGHDTYQSLYKEHHSMQGIREFIAQTFEVKGQEALANQARSKPPQKRRKKEQTLTTIINTTVTEQRSLREAGKERRFQDSLTKAKEYFQAHGKVTTTILGTKLYQHLRSHLGSIKQINTYVEELLAAETPAEITQSKATRSSKILIKHLTKAQEIVKEHGFLTGQLLGTSTYPYLRKTYTSIDNIREAVAETFEAQGEDTLENQARTKILPGPGGRKKRVQQPNAQELLLKPRAQQTKTKTYTTKQKIDFNRAEDLREHIHLSIRAWIASAPTISEAQLIQDEPGLYEQAQAYTISFDHLIGFASISYDIEGKRKPATLQAYEKEAQRQAWQETLSHYDRESAVGKTLNRVLIKLTQEPSEYAFLRNLIGEEVKQRAHLGDLEDTVYHVLKNTVGNRVIDLTMRKLSRNIVDTNIREDIQKHRIKAVQDLQSIIYSNKEQIDDFKGVLEHLKEQVKAGNYEQTTHRRKALP